MNIKDFLLLEDLTFVTNTGNFKINKFIENSVKNMFTQQYYRDVISRMPFFRKPIKIEFAKNTQRANDPEGFRTVASSHFTEGDFYIKINKTVGNRPELQKLVSHEFIHILQKTLANQDKLFSRFQFLFAKIVTQGLKPGFTVNDFVLGKSGPEYLPTEEILAYLFNKRLKWNTIQPEALLQIANMLIKVKIFNPYNAAIRWNLKEIRKNLGPYFKKLGVNKHAR